MCINKYISNLLYVKNKCTEEIEMEEFVARLAKVAEFIEGIVADKEALKEAEARVAELQAAVDAKDAVIAGLVDAAAAHAAKDEADKAELEAAIVRLEEAAAKAKGRTC